MATSKNASSAQEAENLEERPNTRPSAVRALSTGEPCTINRMVKVLQINLNHCRAAQDLLAQTVIEQQAEVTILSEPYKDKDEGVWQRSSEGRAAIWSCGQPPEHLSQRASRTGYTRAKIKGITFYSCCIAPSVHISEFRTITQEIADDARGRSPILIAGDFNAQFTTLGSASTTQRGTILLEAVPSLNVCILNEGNRSNFQQVRSGVNYRPDLR